MGFFYNLKDKIFSHGASVKSIDSVNDVEYTNATNTSQVVRYITNHDVNLFNGTPADLFGGQQGALTTFLIAAYMKSVPMIYNGQEIGYTIRLNYFNNSTPISWDPNPSFTEAYKQILSFRKNSLALKTGVLNSFSSDDVCAFEKTIGTEKVLVIANFRNTTINYQVPASLVKSVWNNAFTNGASVTLGTQVSLSPYSYTVLKNL